MDDLFTGVFTFQFGAVGTNGSAASWHRGRVVGKFGSHLFGLTADTEHDLLLAPTESREAAPVAQANQRGRGSPAAADPFCLATTGDLQQQENQDPNNLMNCKIS